MRTLLVIICLLMAEAAHGAIAFDSAASDSNTGGLTLNYNVTVVSASNNYCVVAVSWRREPVGAVSSILVDSNTATLIDGITETTYNHNRVELWGIKNVATGSKQVSVTLDGATSDNMVSGTICFTGVNQSTPLGTAAKAEGAGTNAEVIVTSATGEMVVDGVRSHGSGSTVTVGAGQTERYSAADATYNEEAGGSHENGAASVTMNWTVSDDAWVIVGVPLKPTAATARHSRPIVIQ